jgi:hypothetical protein
VDKVVRGCSRYDLKRQSYAEVEKNKHITTGKHDRQVGLGFRCDTVKRLVLHTSAVDLVLYTIA